MYKCTQDLLHMYTQGKILNEGFFQAEYTPNANKTGYMRDGLLIQIAKDRESDFKLKPNNKKKVKCEFSLTFAMLKSSS